MVNEYHNTTCFFSLSKGQLGPWAYKTLTERWSRPTQHLKLRQSAKMSKNIFSFLRLLVLLLGFAFICLGAYCFSTSASACKCNSLPIAYFLLPLGFFFLISGIFWSTYHEASKHKGLFHSLMHGSPRLQETQISTIDRYVPCIAFQRLAFDSFPLLMKYFTALPSVCFVKLIWSLTFLFPCYVQLYHWVVHCFLLCSPSYMIVSSSFALVLVPTHQYFFFGFPFYLTHLTHAFPMSHFKCFQNSFHSSIFHMSYICFICFYIKIVFER